jgi:hypothetical protein
MQRTDNSYEMNLAIDRLNAEHIRHEQTTDYQLKVGPYNFYPGTGTIFLDGASDRQPERGLENFLLLIRKLRKRNPHAFQKRATTRVDKDMEGFDLRELE